MAAVVTRVSALAEGAVAVATPEARRSTQAAQAGSVGDLVRVGVVVRVGAGVRKEIDGVAVEVERTVTKVSENKAAALVVVASPMGRGPPDVGGIGAGLETRVAFVIVIAVTHVDVSPPSSESR